MSNGTSNYKDTLNLPQTAFEMRANLLAKEPAIQQRWRRRELYEHIRSAREGRPRFILHDGPPYANGNIHMGHVLNKVLKDIVVRLATLTGHDAPFIPGWDCHGLPIEQEVMDELGAAAVDLPPMEIRRRCREYADKYVHLQSQQFQRLGVLGQWDRPYLTMAPQYEADVLEVLARLVEQGLVYRQLKPVHWSIENQTALADAELEYQDREDASIYVAFRLAGPLPASLPKAAAPAALLVWTTTPWTLPANLAVAVHPDFAYSFVEADTADGKLTLVVAAERLEAVRQVVDQRRPGWLRSHGVLGQATGRQLVDASLKYHHPLLDKLCPVVPALYVTLEDGTGLVHTAPGHGLEDYGTALKEKLEIYCPVRADGTFDDTVPPWLAGRSVWQANPMILEHLRLAGALLADDRVVHSYPHDWRSKTPTIFRATEQFFVAVDRPLQGDGPSLRQLAMETCRRQGSDGGVDFIPAWGRNRLAGMLESRPDWCISRQRAWGLPIPAFYNARGELLLTAASVRAVAKTIVRHGSDAWFTMSPRELLGDYDLAKDPGVQDAARFPLDQLAVGRDTLDVWFDSGSSWFAVAMRRNLVEEIPVDLYLEGSDQHRGWFQTSLLLALAAAGRCPFTAVLTHGYVVGEDGHKMSKSLGNTIDAVEQLNRRGADILRLWAASQNYQDDIRCSEKLIAQAEDAYRKIRNTLRYCMGACFDFDPARHAAEPAGHSLDRWMLMQLALLIRDVRQAYQRYEFHRAARRMYEFCTVQASSVYLSAVKDRLYCESPGAIRRRASQTVIHQMLMALVKLLAPIVPHTCEEAWEHIPFRPASEPADVHLAALPDYDENLTGLMESFQAAPPDLGAVGIDELRAGPAWLWDRLMDLRQEALVKLEALRNAGVKNPLDAEVVFTVPKGADAVADMLSVYLRELEDLCGVGYACVRRGDAPMGDRPLPVQVDVADARGRYGRCARSWKRRPDVGSDRRYPDLSARDAAVMAQLRPPG
jgi:isoleucyl-tRNA synthetase